MNKIQRHKAICEKLNTTYKHKNHDYGNSFELSVDEFGVVAALVRMSDKWNRLKSLASKENKEILVKDESFNDTLLDLANYCIMTYMILNKESIEICDINGYAD